MSPSAANNNNLCDSFIFGALGAINTTNKLNDILVAKARRLQVSLKKYFIIFENL